MRPLNSKGFTLLEILIVIAIFAIGMAIALPTLTQMGQRDQARSATRQVKDQLARARITAIELNTPTICVINPNNLQTGQDANGNGLLDAAEVIDRLNLTNVTMAVTNGLNGNLIQWDRRGYPREQNLNTFTSGTITLTGIDNTQFRIIVSPAGNIQINRP